MISPGNLIGKHIDQFRLDEFIGQGAMGVVYKAFDNVLHRTVALKLIAKDDQPPTPAMMEARRRLIQEAQAAGRLTHPNIVTIHSYGETDEFQYICMEFIIGKTLAEILAEQKILPVEEALIIIEQILLALDVANQGQIVHRDIKPTNIMILNNKQTKVMDFGIAKLPSLSITTTGTVLGTPYYMSPEQISGQKVDIRSDIFSVGALFYQIITGERPFDGETTITLAYKIVQVEPVPPKVLNIHIPQTIENICKKALAKDPTFRYQSPMEMLEDIRAYKRRATVSRPMTEDTTIKTRVAIPVRKTPEEIMGEKTQISPGKTEEKPKEVPKKATIATPSSPSPDIEIPVPPKPAVSKAPPAPGKASGSALKPITFAFGLLIIVVIGIILVVRFAKTGPQYNRPDQLTIQESNQGSSQPQVNPPEQKATPNLDSLIIQAKDQLKINPTNARTLLEQALFIDPNNFEANLQLARHFTFQQEYQKAIPYYQKALKINSRVPEVSFNLGFIYLNLGQYDLAINSYAICRALSPPFLDEVLTNMSLCYIKKNNFQQAQLLLREALVLNPKNTIAQNYLKSIGG
ncbi:MAG: protein kinase [Deltaproteobacteria bacterium]|nr:protein kinase [Deltaproteobacteria bacterium]